MDEDFDFDLSELPINEQLSVINDIVPHTLREKFGNSYKEYVTVKRSTLKDDNNNPIGFGLFATKNIKDNEIICIYAGDELPKYITQDRSYISDYVAELNNTTVIDAKNPFSCFARYINDGMTEEINNSNWTKTKGLLKIKATKKINKGEEIFLTYGSYWAEKEQFERLTTTSKLLLYEDDRKDVNLWIDENYKYDANTNEWYRILAVNKRGQKIMTKI